MIVQWLVALMLVGNVSPRDQDEIDRNVRTILEDPAYGFCHDEAYPLTRDEASWCPVVDDGIPRCPAFDDACAAPRAELLGPGGRLSKRTVDADPSARAQGQGPDRAHEPEPAEFEVPELGGVAAFLFWGVVALAVVLIALAIAKNFLRGKEPEPKPEVDAGGSTDRAVTLLAEAQREMEVDVDRLLAMARDCAGRGEFADAVDFSHAALLRRLDHEGLIRLHRARTNGDYVFDLRTNAELRGPVRDVLRRVDRAQFGTEAPARPAFEAIFERVGAIVRKAGPLVLLALTVAGASCDGPETGKNYPWSTSPSGNDGVVRLLKARGFEPAYRLAKLEGFGEDTLHGSLVIVLLQSAEPTENEWEALEDWVDEGGRLVVAGAAIPDWLDAEYRAAEPALPGRAWVTEPNRETYPVPYVVVPEADVLWAPSAEMLLEGERGAYAVTYSRGAGTVLVLADDRLLTNASLPIFDNAIFLDRMLGELGVRIEFVDAWANAGADDPLESIRRTHLTPAVIQLLVLILALYFWRGARFGRARDPIAFSRRAFVQHAAAMGQQYTKARATGHAAAAYSSWVLERLRDRFPTAASGGLHGVAQQVARRSGRDETEVMRLLVEAHGAAESRAGVGAPAEDLALVRDLGRLMREGRV